MKRTEVDALIVGGGPAGLAAAIELKKNGVKNVRVIEREKDAGGVPRHSFHPGYGLRDFKQFLSGPKYAKKYVAAALAAGVLTKVQFTGILLAVIASIIVSTLARSMIKPVSMPTAPA